MKKLRKFQYSARKNFLIEKTCIMFELHLRSQTREWSEAQKNVSCLCTIISFSFKPSSKFRPRQRAVIRLETVAINSGYFQNHLLLCCVETNFYA